MAEVKSLLSFINDFNYMIFLLLTILYGYQALYILISLFLQDPEPKAKQLHKYGVVIAARNEEKVIGELDSCRDMIVQTFAPGVPEGEAARRLYMKYGFADRRDGGLNPAGIPTVIMVREKK